ncbi:MAG: SpoIID/LytB domain-containing protein, partial [Peptostreptococcaceae bacterium]|nr:SpoIID/LytB domain-containing protein [Peptostreptococcaceae bacterium]
MKRIIKQIAVLLLGIALATSVSWAKGYDNDLKLRVGIFYGSKAKSSYRIGGSQLFVVAGGRVVLSTGASEMQVSKAGTIYHSPESYASYEEASSGGKMVYYNNGAFYKVSEFYTAGYQPNSDANILIRANDGRSLVLLGGVDQYIESGNGIVSIEGVQYREKAHVLHDGKKIIAINIVGLDHYLKGVVPKEMPPNWHIEALKAQSVVARNYVLTNVNKHVSEGFHVCNTTNCQVYGGASAQTPMTDLAVELTSGELMYYGGGVVEGYFHASSGGQTETSTNIWGSAWRPYLTGLNDPFSLGGPYDLWSVTMSSEEIRRQLANSGVNIGQVVGLSITQVSPNGRVMELVVHGSGGSHALKKERIRTVLGSNKLKSIFFTLQGSARVAGASIASSGRPSDKAAKTSLDDLFKDLSAVLDKQAA